MDWKLFGNEVGGSDEKELFYPPPTSPVSSQILTFSYPSFLWFSEVQGKELLPEVLPHNKLYHGPIITNFTPHFPPIPREASWLPGRLYSSLVFLLSTSGFCAGSKMAFFK